MKEKVYKVVRKSNKVGVISYKSVLGYNYPRKYNLTYRLNEVTKAAVGSLGILVFLRIHDAEEFAGRNRKGGPHILECETEELIEKKIDLVAFVGRLTEFYCSQSKIIYGWSTTAPDGTYACRSLIPRKVIRRED